MKAITFILSGKTAFFKKPDVNSYAYFTYNNIPKISLLGMLGAIIGLNGYRQQEKKHFPEFYEILKDLKVSIVPLTNKGYFSKKIQVINNTTGFYNKDSKRQPCTLNYREQWIHNPKWRIYLLDNNSIDKGTFNKLCDYLINKKCEFIPYLGKNDHPANISKAEIVELTEIDSPINVDSIMTSKIKIGNLTNDGSPYQYLESYPTRLNNIDNEYEFDEFLYTNLIIKDYPSDIKFYKHLNHILYFF